MVSPCKDNSVRTLPHRAENPATRFQLVRTEEMDERNVFKELKQVQLPMIQHLHYIHECLKSEN